MKVKQLFQIRFIILLFSIVLFNNKFFPQSITDFFPDSKNNTIDKKNLISPNPSLMKILKKHLSITNATLLDSMIAAKYDTAAQEVKTTYQYNEMKKLTKVTVESFDDDEIKTGDSYVFSYNGENLSSVFTYKFDGTNWVPVNKTSNNFDPNGNNILTVNEKFENVTSTWIGINRSNRTFDSNNNLLTEMTEIWDSAAAAWKKFGLVENTYNGSNQKISTTAKINVAEVWFNFSKNTYTYGTNNTLQEDKSFSWNYTDNVWIDKGIITYEYNENNLEISSLEKEWRDNAWVNKKRITKNYISNLLLNYNLVENWENETWVKDNDFTISYDSDGLIKIYSAMNKWNGSGWDEGDKLTFDYDTNNMCDYVKHESWFQNHWVSSDGILWPSNLLTYSPDFMIYYLTNGYEADLFYQDPTSIKLNNTILSDGIILSQNYPNPFNPATIIKYQITNSKKQIKHNGEILNKVTLKVYNILGREVSTLVNEEKQPGNYQVLFDGSGLASGTYFYELRVGDFKKVNKMTFIK